LSEVHRLPRPRHRGVGGKPLRLQPGTSSRAVRPTASRSPV
jgi:hypothetical protein